MKTLISIVLNNFKNDSRVLKENISLKSFGFDPIVVALHEGDLAEFEDISGVAVHRIKLKSRSLPKYKFFQVVKYVEFVFQVIKSYKKNDIFHCNDLNALLSGFLIKTFFNKQAKVIYDAHEYETEVNGYGFVMKTLTKILEKNIIKCADKIITVSDAIADEYVRLYGIKKPYIVLNTPFYKEIEKKDIFRKKFNIKKEQNIFLYQGRLSKGRGVEITLGAFEALKDDKCVVVFMGYG
ncbi:MAG: glycosyltransferase family 4 protein, partial [Campylobacteraceae bacterium]|nr:glycosyltransferase family 4 protein [Campylobacteraceae bacterium]